MNKLNTRPNLADPDGLYEQLLAMHEGHDKKASQQINAKLILLLANHIGDQEILNEAIALASSNTKGSK